MGFNEVPEQKECLQRFRNKTTQRMETCHKKLNHLGKHKS